MITNKRRMIVLGSIPLLVNLTVDVPLFHLAGIVALRVPESHGSVGQSMNNYIVCNKIGRQSDLRLIIDDIIKQERAHTLSPCSG